MLAKVKQIPWLCAMTQIRFKMKWVLSLANATSFMKIILPRFCAILLTDRQTNKQKVKQTNHTKIITSLAEVTVHIRKRMVQSRADIIPKQAGRWTSDCKLPLGVNKMCEQWTFNGLAYHPGGVPAKEPFISLDPP